MNTDQDINEFIVRNVESTDIDNLIVFFRKAYGKDTIFQFPEFLQYFFSSRKEPFPFMGTCMIALNSTGEIVSHYGGLVYKIKIYNEIHTLIWGANAYTLPTWRGKGINSAIVSSLLANNEINGVIGFTKKTALFYEKIGFNIFNFQRFSRYAFVIDKVKTDEVIDFIKQDKKQLPRLYENQKTSADTEQVVELTSENIRTYELGLEEVSSGIITTHRTLEFLKWRIIENPFIKYKVFGFVKNGKISTYIAIREEILNPLGYSISRVVDLFGNKEGVNPLLNITIQEAILNGHIYIDFSMFGKIYHEELSSSGFIKLENDDCSILPQVTAPIEYRPNNEYIGLFSKIHQGTIANLEAENVYFTRIDSDRDRLGRIISQENNNHE